jgi:hypothetical protein
MTKARMGRLRGMIRLVPSVEERRDAPAVKVGIV